MQNKELQLEDALLYRNPRAAIVLLNSDGDGQTLDRSTKIKLTYVRMISLSLDQLLELLETSLLIPYDLPDFLLTEMITKYIDSDLNVQNESKLLLKLKEIIEKNQESIGSKELIVGGKKIPPTTQNWIADYNSFYAVGGGDHDPLNQIKYINSSDNVRGLDEKSKIILIDILKLYDRSVSFTILWDSLEVSDNVGQLFEEKDITEFLPDLEEESSGASLNTQTTVNEPVAQNVQLGEPEPPFQNNTTLAPDTQQAKIDRNLQVGSDENEFKIPQQRDLDLSRQAKRGLVFDEPTNVDLTEVAKRREEELKKQRAIDEKLNALKQRKQK